jgi:hypothetical protein
VSHGYGETCLHLILVFPVIELFRMKVINNGSASSVRDIVERRDQGGKWPLGSAVRLVMFRYVKIRHLIVDVLDNIMRNFSAGWQVVSRFRCETCDVSLCKDTTFDRGGFRQYHEELFSHTDS